MRVDRANASGSRRRARPEPIGRCRSSARRKKSSTIRLEQSRRAEPEGLSGSEATLASWSVFLCYSLAAFMAAGFVTLVVVRLDGSDGGLTGRNASFIILIPLSVLSAWCASVAANVSRSTVRCTLTSDQVKLWREAIRFPLAMGTVWGAFLLLVIGVNSLHMKDTGEVAIAVATLLSLGSLVQAATGLQTTLSLRASCEDEVDFCGWIRTSPGWAACLGVVVIVMLLLGWSAGAQAEPSSPEIWKCQVDPVTSAPPLNPLTKGASALCSPGSSE